MDIRIQKNLSLKQKPSDESTLGFGKNFSDHMFIMEYSPSEGWHNARIQELAPLALHPAAPIFHYAQAVFEGTKVFRRADGEVQFFRLRDNCQRLNNSALRTCMPIIEVEQQYEAIERLVDIERAWVPSALGTSLYLRPLLCSAGTGLGASAAAEYMFFVICSPSGSYYAKGLKPVRIRIEPHYVRAVKGGMGFAKAGGNYASSFKATYEAKLDGFDQVLWLDGIERKYVQEVGAMNMMFVLDGKIITAELGDTILPGITRDSILTLARDLGYVVEERAISVEEIYNAHAKGTLTEAFGTGTAAVVSPVGELQYKGQSIIINNNEIGPIAQQFYTLLTDIQYGKTADKYGWTSIVRHF